jgi:hypothetical protein
VPRATAGLATEIRSETRPRRPGEGHRLATERCPKTRSRRPTSMLRGSVRFILAGQVSGGMHFANAAESHLAEQVCERLADLKCFAAVLEMQHRVASRVSRHLRNRIDVDDGGSMNLPEFGRVEHIEQLL